MHFKSVMRNMNVMNAALVGILVLVAGYEFPSFFHAHATYTPPSPAKSVEAEEKTVEAQPLSPSEYTVIAEQNIFHPERKIPVVTAEAPPLPKPEFVLYGTLITSDLSLAYMEDLKSVVNSPARGKRQMALRKGETISGFTLKKIETDKVLMIRGEEKLEVRITDKPRSKGNGTASAPQGSLFPSVSRPMEQPAQPPQIQTDDVRKRREALRNMSRSRGN